MKKKCIAIFLIIITLFTMTGCKSFALSVKTVGKENTTAKKMASVIAENMAESKRMKDYALYAIEMSMNNEGIGMAKLIYTNKLPQDLKYSDIMIVTVDTRTGKVVSTKEANFETSGTKPYEQIIHGAPLHMEDWKEDSESARTIAEHTFYSEENFVYNYVQISATYQEGVQQYEVVFVSLVNELQYICRVDGMSGTVLSKEIIDL